MTLDVLYMINRLAHHVANGEPMKHVQLDACASALHKSKSEPDTIVSLLSLRPLTAMSDLQWASAMKFKD